MIKIMKIHKSAAKRPRWVSPELSNLKHAADSAGHAVHQADLRCKDSEFQYIWYRQLENIKPMEIAGWIPDEELLARSRAELLATIDYWNSERKIAHMKLEETRTELKKQLSAFRAAKLVSLQ